MVVFTVMVRAAIDYFYQFEGFEFSFPEKYGHEKLTKYGARAGVTASIFELITSSTNKLRRRRSTNLVRCSRV